MDRKLALVALLLVLGSTLVGCSAPEGANDPVVDGKTLDQQRERGMDPGDREKMQATRGGTPDGGRR